MIEKLGITETTPGWEDEAKREMLEALIDAVGITEGILGCEKDAQYYRETIERAVGLTWAQVKERMNLKEHYQFIEKYLLDTGADNQYLNSLEEIYLLAKQMMDS